MTTLANGNSLLVRFAHEHDIDQCKRIADTQRDAIGFLAKAIFADALRRTQLIIAETTDGSVVGFVRFNHRQRGVETAIYDLCVDPAVQRQGVGRQLVEHVATAGRQRERQAVILRCPEGLDANHFYPRVGFRCLGVEEGKKRRLMVWRLNLESEACNS